MNEDIQALISSHEFLKGSWIQNTRNYDGALAQIIEPLVGWKRERASSHDFVTSRGEKVEIKKFQNGNGWLAGSNVAKTPAGVLYLFVCYKNNKVTKLVLADIEEVLDYIEKDFPLDLLEKVSNYKVANCQIRVKCSDIAGKEYVC
jgi:hypothetical protein